MDSPEYKMFAAVRFSEIFLAGTIEKTESCWKEIESLRNAVIECQLYTRNIVERASKVAISSPYFLSISHLETCPDSFLTDKRRAELSISGWGSDSSDDRTFLSGRTAWRIASKSQQLREPQLTCQYEEVFFYFMFSSSDGCPW